MDHPYRFGRYELDAATRQLRVEELPAVVGPNALDMLPALIERREQLYRRTLPKTLLQTNCFAILSRVAFISSPRNSRSA